VAARIEHARHVVVEEAAGVRGQARLLPGAVLDPGERARQAGRHHQHQPRGGHHLEPDHPEVPPRDEAAEQSQGQESEVQAHGDVRDGFVTTHVTNYEAENPRV
jgi:hypothetical protein